jgi:flagella basal body P-ring formation protein FlgA
VVAVVLGCSSLLLAQGKTVIHVFPESVIEKDSVNLGSIASITGGAVSALRLGNISLGYAPRIGSTRSISRDQLTLAISAAGFGSHEFTLESPASVNIKRLGQTIPETAVIGEINRSIREIIAAEGVTFRIVRLDLPQVGQVPTGKFDIRIDRSGVRTFLSGFSLPVEIRVDGKTVSRFSVTIELEAYAEIYVATRDLTERSKITVNDVRLEKRKLARAITDYVRESDRLKGTILIKNIATGAEVTTDSLIAGTVIQAGDGVNIEARSGDVKIIVRGEARSSGKIGDRIAVKNTQSGAILQARIVEEGLVSVIF